MARGIIEWVGLAATLALAAHLALAGVGFAMDGRPLGWALLALAVLAIAIEEYAVRPGDLPGSVAGKVVGTVAKEPEEDE